MPHATRPGDVLAGRYRLVDLLTESGDGRFWRAHDRVLERHVALHVIAASDPRATRLREAARRSAAVVDPRVLRVLDVDVEDDVCYVVNEWGWGTSLDIVAAGAGALGPRRAAWLVAEVADTIAHAHAAGVAHGRLTPENVLIDRSGEVRLIGLCVDAALHGLPPDRPEQDVADLSGLLYCSLTARWAGASGSHVRPAPRTHGVVLRPRQVRAGIPRPLDELCDRLLHPEAVGRHRDLGLQEVSARGICDFLLDFVGDPTGMPEALLASIPDVLPDEEQVSLPPVPELTPHDAQRLATPHPEAPPTARRGGEPAVAPPTEPTDLRPDEADEPPEPDDPPEPDAEGPAAAPPADDPEAGGPTGAAGLTGPADRPTEAGVPIFGEGDDVGWLERRRPPPPPPPFEDPPERPLFAPEPPDGTPRRRPRPTPADSGVRPHDEYWPWDTGTGARRPVPDGGDPRDTGEGAPVPGRRWQRLGVVLVVLLLLAILAVALVNVGRGRTPLGSVPDDEGDSPSASASASQRDRPVAPLTGLSAAVLDPQGTDGGFENDDEAPNAVDGDDATTWDTQGYNDQLGPPPGLKTGVGLVLDLGGRHEVDQVDLTFTGGATSAEVYLADEPPDDVAGLEPAAEGTSGDDGSLRLSLEDPAGASYLVVWLTALPPDDDGRFRGHLAEAVVRGR